MLKFLRFDLGIDSVQTHPRENSENMCLFNEVGYIWVKFCIVVNEFFLNLEVINIFYLQRNSFAIDTNIKAIRYNIILCYHEKLLHNLL